MWSMCQDLSASHDVIAYDEGGEQLPGMAYQTIQQGMYGKYADATASFNPDNPYGHGHNYELEAYFSGPVDPVTGMIANLADVDQWLRATVASVSGKHLDLPGRQSYPET